MNARRLIEAETAREFSTRHRILKGTKPTPLTWDQIERFSDILAYGPINRRSSDEIFIKAGLAEPYEGEETAIDATRMAHKAFYNAAGSVRKIWVADPNYKEF